MPTGYTAELMEKGEPFNRFVMRCARAFGALIDLRDAQMDAPIPEKFEPSDYHVKALAKALAELERLDAGIIYLNPLTSKRESCIILVMESPIPNDRRT